MGSSFHKGFYFKLSFQGLGGSSDAAFQEAAGLAKEIKIEELGSGGENRFKYRVPNGTTFQNLVLKRGVATATSSLIDWCSKTLDQGLAKPIVTRNITLDLLNDAGKTCSSWTFNNAYPVKWSASDLNSQNNALLIETIEFAYQYFDLGSVKV